MFLVYVVLPTSSDLGFEVYPIYRAQIVFLTVDKTFISVLFYFANFVNVFSNHLIVILLEHTRINYYTNNLIYCQQLFYKPIDSLKPVKLETLKIYIKINLANNFIRPAKFSNNISIFFVNKSNGSF